MVCAGSGAFSALLASCAASKLTFLADDNGLSPVLVGVAQKSLNMKALARWEHSLHVLIQASISIIALLVDNVD
jgi:hypothetical protein